MVVIQRNDNYFLLGENIKRPRCDPQNGETVTHADIEGLICNLYHLLSEFFRVQVCVSNYELTVNLLTHSAKVKIHLVFCQTKYHWH